MKDSHLLITSLITGIAGLILLYFLSENLELEESSISKLDELNDYDDVKVVGKIVKLGGNENLTIITIAKEEFVKVVLFEKLDLETGLNVEISGQVKEYRGEKEILAEKIKVVSKS